jgi:hypothetical protein
VSTDSSGRATRNGARRASDTHLYASADDPPVILFYAEPDEPLPADAKPGQGIHHPRFGAALKAKLDPLGVECLVRHTKDFPEPDDPKEREFREMTNFFVSHFHK